MPRLAIAARQPGSALTISSTAMNSSSMIGGWPSVSGSSSVTRSTSPAGQRHQHGAGRARYAVSSSTARTRRCTGSPSRKASTSRLGRLLQREHRAAHGRRRAARPRSGSPGRSISAASSRSSGWPTAVRAEFGVASCVVSIGTPRVSGGAAAAGAAPAGRARLLVGVRGQRDVPDPGVHGRAGGRAAPAPQARPTAAARKHQRRQHPAQRRRRRPRAASRSWPPAGRPRAEQHDRQRRGDRPLPQRAGSPGCRRKNPTTAAEVAAISSDHPERGHPAEPGEQLQHRVGAAQRRTTTSTTTAVTVCSGRAGDRAAGAGADGVQELGQHPLPAQREQVPGDAVVEAQQRGEHAGQEQHVGDVGDDRAPVLGERAEDQTGPVLGGRGLQVVRADGDRHGPGREGVEEPGEGDRDEGGPGDGALRVAALLAVDGAGLEADEAAMPNAKTAPTPGTNSSAGVEAGEGDRAARRVAEARRCRRARTAMHSRPSSTARTAAFRSTRSTPSDADQHAAPRSAQTHQARSSPKVAVGEVGEAGAEQPVQADLDGVVGDQRDERAGDADRPAEARAPGRSRTRRRWRRTGSSRRSRPRTGPAPRPGRGTTAARRRCRSPRTSWSRRRRARSAAPTRRP